MYKLFLIIVLAYFSISSKCQIQVDVIDGFNVYENVSISYIDSIGNLNIPVAVYVTIDNVSYYVDAYDPDDKYYLIFSKDDYFESTSIRGVLSYLLIYHNNPEYE